MKVAYCGPISLSILAPQFASEHELGDGYAYPFGAYYVQELLRRGHEVIVVTNVFSASKVLEYESGPLKVIVCPRRRPKHFIFDAYRKERSLIQTTLSDSGADVVHAQWCYEFAHAAKASGLPFIVTLRDAPWSVLKHFRSGYRLFRLIYSYFVLSGVRHLTTVSDYIAASFRSCYRKKDIVVVPNALDATIVSLQHKVRSAETPLHLVSTSAWGRLKNCKALFRVFEQVRQVYPDAVLSVIGSGLEEGGAGELWAQENGLATGVQFLGRVPHAEILTMLEESADLFVYTSLQESFCMAVLEAMAKGVPSVVFPDSGALPWLVGDGAGIVAETQEVEDMADACIRLLEDSAQYEQVSQLALARVRKMFTMEAVTDAYLKVYRAAINECESARGEAL
jgi:glycosyltransferase involved in cell wall biosynthesis